MFFNTILYAGLGFSTSIRHLLLSDYFFRKLFNENHVNHNLNLNPNPNLTLTPNPNLTLIPNPNPNPKP